MNLLKTILDCLLHLLHIYVYIYIHTHVYWYTFSRVEVMHILYMLRCHYQSWRPRQRPSIGAYVLESPSQANLYYYQDHRSLHCYLLTKIDQPGNQANQACFIHFVSVYKLSVVSIPTSTCVVFIIMPTHHCHHLRCTYHRYCCWCTSNCGCFLNYQVY